MDSEAHPPITGRIKAPRLWVAPATGISLSGSYSLNCISSSQLIVSAQQKKRSPEQVKVRSVCRRFDTFTYRQERRVSINPFFGCLYGAIEPVRMLRRSCRMKAVLRPSSVIGGYRLQPLKAC